MAEGQDNQKKITVNIKTPKEKQIVEIKDDALIKDVSVNRKLLSNQCDVFAYFALFFLLDCLVIMQCWQVLFFNITNFLNFSLKMRLPKSLRRSLNNYVSYLLVK